MISFTAKKQEKLSKYITENIDGISYSAIFKLLRNKDVKINGKRTNKDVKLNIGDKIDVYYNICDDYGYTVIYKDENVLIINKKSGWTAENIYNAVKRQIKSAKFIHRLDRNTSGVMVFALNEIAEKELLIGFKNRDFIKYYTAEVIGQMEKKEDELTAYLVKDEVASTVKISKNNVSGSVKIKTGYSVQKELEETSILRVRLYTGKTHQIRAHLAFLGHPIVGDEKYGDNAFNKKVGLKRQKLVASEIIFSFNKNQTLYYLNGKSFKAE